jgi:hypothetical protein
MHTYRPWLGQSQQPVAQSAACSSSNKEKQLNGALPQVCCYTACIQQHANSCPPLHLPPALASPSSHLWVSVQPGQEGLSTLVLANWEQQQHTCAAQTQHHIPSARAIVYWRAPWTVHEIQHARETQACLVGSNHVCAAAAAADVLLLLMPQCTTSAAAGYQVMAHSTECFAPWQNSNATALGPYCAASLC